MVLEALPAAVRDRLNPHLERVPLALGDVLYESGDTMRHVYFPIDAIVSLLYVMENGAFGEIAVVGYEGVVGIALFVGGESTPSLVLVQSAGNTWRLPGQVLKDEFHRHTELQFLLLRYTQALITQMAQTAVCNRHRSIDQQLCRWLLLSLDRLSGSQLAMTQELIANMLGVRREGVTEAAGKLQKAGLIDYSRGLITVLDRPGLEHRCCECYAVVKTETDRLLTYASARWCAVRHQRLFSLWQCAAGKCGWSYLAVRSGLLRQLCALSNTGNGCSRSQIRSRSRKARRDNRCAPLATGRSRRRRRAGACNRIHQPCGFPHCRYGRPR